MIILSAISLSYYRGCLLTPDLRQTKPATVAACCQQRVEDGKGKLLFVLALVWISLAGGILIKIELLFQSGRSMGPWWQAPLGGWGRRG